MVARWTQALMAEQSWAPGDRWAPGRHQLYVDDPTVCCWGSPRCRATTFSLVVLFWLVLGIPLSWRKGALHACTEPHQWIGVVFASPRPGVARMWLPAAFIEALATLCRAFAPGKGHQPLASAHALVGKGGRVAHVLPLTRPFVASLFAALSGATKAADAGAKEAPPGAVACRRFAYGARMLLRILGFEDRRAPVPHSRDILAVRPLTPPLTKRRIEIDASPWGGGECCIRKAAPQDTSAASGRQRTSNTLA